MKHFRLKILLTSLVAAGLIVVFSWIIAWQSQQRLAQEASGKKHLTPEPVDYTLNNLSEAWKEYEQKIINRYEVEAVFAALALERVIDSEAVPENSHGNGIVISIQDGKLSSLDPAVKTLGLDASLFQGKRGSFPAPQQPTTFVVYSRIGNTPRYYVKWFQDTVIEDIVRETVEIPGILKWTEINYDVPAIFVSCDSDSGEITGIAYKNNRYFSNCGSLEDLGLTKEDLEKNDAKTPGNLSYDESRFSYYSGKSAVPSGYVIVLEPEPDLYAKAFVQEGYMIAALIILITSLLVGGFSLYLFVRNNILTPDEERNYQPFHIRSVTSLFGVLGLVIIVLCGMFSYALNTMYDDVVRGRERLAMMDESISMYADRYERNEKRFYDIYLDYGNLIAGFLDTYPQLRDPETLQTLSESISASSITLYDSDGCETVSSGPWKGLELGRDPDSTTYDFRRILRGVPSIIHDPETDEVTGLNEMRLGIQIRDDSSEDQYGVMMICVNIPVMTNHDIDPEASVRQIFSNLSDNVTTLWVSDGKTGRILVSSRQELEGEDIAGMGLGKPNLKDSLMKAQNTEEGDFLVMSAAMETPEVLEWAGQSKSIIVYCRSPKSSVFPGMLILVVTSAILFLVIYSILAWMILAGYTDEFFNTNKHTKGQEDPNKKRNRLQKAIAAATPVRKGIVVMEILTAFFLLQVILITNSSSTAARSTVFRYIAVGDWERGLNLFSIAAIMILLTKTVLLVIGLRFLLAVCSYFSGSKGRTVFRLISNVILYIALILSAIKVLEYLGFSAATIAAGVGSLALAISLGAQNFVADIFAGLTYVFEGTVHVGDTVEIAASGSPNIQGKIVEVGVRCIKLLTREGDIISCNNRDIRTVKNSTQLNSRVICELAVSSVIPSDELERILKTELPKIGLADRRILSGPIYNGITGINDGKMTLSVSAECNEEDYFYVRDKLYVSLQQIFMNHGYSI